MTSITLNGESRQLEEKTSVSQLLDSLDLSGQRLAVEINREIVPRSEFTELFLSDGDTVEIVQAIGGG